MPSNVKFSRLPSPLEVSSLTAEQWMVWVNYYSLYCLYELIPMEQYECWRDFVLASRLLSKASISKDMVILADGLLLRFCQKFQGIFGQDLVTPNMHLHCHLASCVRDFGPMASFWCFSFERMNGVLGDQPSNNRSIEVQLMHSTAPKEHIYKSLRFVHSPMSLFIFKQVYKKFTTLVYSSSSTMNLQAKIGVYKAVNSCK